MRTLGLAALLLLLAGCRSPLVEVRYEKLERATLVSTRSIGADDAGGPLDFRMWYGSLGRVVLPPQEILFALSWDSRSYWPDTQMLTLRGNGKRLEVPVLVKSAATRMGESWEIRASGHVTPEQMQAIFPAGSTAGAEGELGPMTFTLGPDVAVALDEMLKKPGTAVE